MSLQAIVEKIKVDTDTEIQSVFTEVAKRVAGIVQDTDQQIAEITASFASSVEKQKIQRETVMRSLEKQKANMAIQTTKRRLLDEVYSKALDEIYALSSVEYVAMLTDKYKTLVPKDVKVVSVLSPENRQSETAEISKILGWSATISVNDKLKGGCVLVGENFEFDLSVESLFTEERTKSEIEIAQMLFPVK
ncbi:MAG: hypothetical protein KBC78_02670 [Candidatus Pacebacteria bacterium]|nr:hypothetical protein [Candidatus Paceibacterota bacterium]